MNRRQLEQIVVDVVDALVDLVRAPEQRRRRPALIPVTDERRRRRRHG